MPDQTTPPRVPGDVIGYVAAWRMSSAWAVGDDDEWVGIEESQVEAVAVGEKWKRERSLEVEVMAVCRLNGRPRALTEDLDVDGYLNMLDGLRKFLAAEGFDERRVTDAVDDLGEALNTVKSRTEQDAQDLAIGRLLFPALSVLQDDDGVLLRKGRTAREAVDSVRAGTPGGGV